jgi:hydroxymethylpyrimidine/phosphomethylpyrimidine kinase
MVPVSRPAFGVSRHIARIILTVMRYDPNYRAAMNIRYSENILSSCKELGLIVESFDRGKEPEAIKKMEGSSLEWGTDQILEGRKEIPDVIYDQGDVGKEPMVRILGRDPGDVVEKALKIAKSLKA